MEGVDKDWVYIRDGRRFAYYNLASKGKRTFCVKGNRCKRIYGVVL